MSRLIELRLKQQVLQKKMDAIEAELDLVFHQIDEEMEQQLENNPIREVSTPEGMYLTNEDLHKLLSYLVHSITPKNEGSSDKQRSNLIDVNEDISWTIAEHLGIDLNDGYIEPTNFTYKKY